ncbi:hypothetical protein AQUCO_01200192v1 [Aquilegia coerulea]|uniref:3-oxo-5-alpha-steroid 4-dehydrogenase C-terminal domain-containing protein n=1 Tax=Aquilegia coerulea TaxID=218851 RepID=A0A2G5E4U4_AQUCA|nr:hypothetical protein AQUCO_01200192v1 [Aquilegia coerulea]
MSLLSSFLFPSPPSIFITAMSVIFVPLSAIFGIFEIKGIHLKFSKFLNVSSQKAISRSKVIKLSSRTGMLTFYIPAFLAAVLSLGFFPNNELRFKLIVVALTIHFSKRIFEVLFVHKYSGGMSLDTAILISFSLCFSSVTMIYNQHLTQNIPEPSLDLKYVGVVLHLLGIIGNFYHHNILANLREKDDKGYKIPKGCLFNLVVCPHYLFEVLDFLGVSFISQTVYPFCFTVGSTLYLMGRSYATRKWYLSKFPNFPKEVKAMIPYVF